MTTNNYFYKIISNYFYKIIQLERPSCSYNLKKLTFTSLYSTLLNNCALSDLAFLVSSDVEAHNTFGIFLFVPVLFK